MGLAEFVFYFGILIMQFKAFGMIAKSLFNLPAQYENLCVVCFAVFLSLYTFKRGFIAVALTDILQFWVFAIAFISLIIVITIKTNFFAGVWDKGVIENPKMTIAPCFKDYNITLLTIGRWFCSIFLKLNGPRYQRIMACNDSKKVKQSLLWTAAIVALASIIYTCVTLLIYSENPNLTITEIIPLFVNNYWFERFTWCWFVCYEYFNSRIFFE